MTPRPSTKTVSATYFKEDECYALTVSQLEVLRGSDAGYWKSSFIFSIGMMVPFIVNAVSLWPDDLSKPQGFSGGFIWNSLAAGALLPFVVANGVQWCRKFRGWDSSLEAIRQSGVHKGTFKAETAGFERVDAA